MVDPSATYGSYGSSRGVDRRVPAASKLGAGHQSHWYRVWLAF